MGLKSAEKAQNDGKVQKPTNPAGNPVGQARSQYGLTHMPKLFKTPPNETPNSTGAGCFIRSHILNA